MVTQTLGFFPPLLGVGSHDKGPGGPIQFLQRFLLSLSCTVPELRDHGRYDEATFRSVVLLQERLQMIAGEPGREFLAGVFDEATRDALRRRHHINFSLLEGENGSGCIYIGGDGCPQEWPKAVELAVAAQ